MAGIVSKVFAFCCSNKRNTDVDDSNVDAVIARNLWKNHRILPPNSRFKQNWDLFMVRAHISEPPSQTAQSSDEALLRLFCGFGSAAGVG